MEVWINGKKYLATEKLGQGAHGSVFKIKGRRVDNTLALKIMQAKSSEFDIIEELKSEKGFPKIISRFQENEYEWAAMTLFGINLKTLKTVSA